MNIYFQRFRALCPRNKTRVDYVLRIEAGAVIMVEDLQYFVAGISEGYHEGIADDLYAAFGGVQTLDAHHHGTDIRTVRP